MTSPIPVSVISGYLGAGKTTLINALLRDRGDRRLAILVNEFGDLPIDEHLIVEETDNLITLTGGCICCAFGDNLIGALREFASAQSPPDHIVIEASGVAIPSSISGTVSLMPGLLPNGSIVLADGETVQSQSRDRYVGDTILRQLNDADLIVLTKSDLLTPDQVAECRTFLEEHGNGAPVVAAQMGQVPPAILLDAVAQAAPSDAHPPAAAQFDSVVLEITDVTDVQRFADSVTSAQAGVIRSKGFLRDTNGQIWLIQSVGPRCSIAKADSQSKIGLVCIGIAGKLNVAGLVSSN